MNKNYVQRFFWWLAGANAELLESRQCETERMKYTGMGMTVLATSIIGGLSGGYALLLVFGSPLIAGILGTFWGGVTITMDRSFLLTTKDTHTVWDKTKIALPRLMMASMLGLIISKPVELRIFQAEIVAQLAESKQTSSLEGQKLKTLQAKRDQQAQAVETARNQWSQENQDAIQEAQGKKGSGIPGRGDVFDLKTETAERSREVLEQQEQILAQIDQSIAQQESQLTTVTDDILAGQASLLDQLSALSELSHKKPALAMAIYSITLLFITLEISPILVKLMSPQGPYEKLLAAKYDRIDHDITCDTTEANENRSQQMELRRELRQCRLDQLRIKIREVFTEQYALALQLMLSQPSYAQSLQQVVNVLQDNVISTLIHEAQNTYLYDETQKQEMKSMMTDLHSHHQTQNQHASSTQGNINDLQAMVQEMREQANIAENS